MSDSRPDNLLLHACCAPCSVAVIDELRCELRLAVLFYNPNVQPEAEYLKRKAEVTRLCADWLVPMFDLDYGSELWEEVVAPVAQAGEDGPRCAACFRLRLARTAEFARRQGFGAFATSLTMSRRKDAATVNAVGRAVGESFGVRFVDEVWRRGGRAEKGERLVEERGIYRQNYCGCRFSLAYSKERAVDRTAA